MGFLISLVAAWLGGIAGSLAFPAANLWWLLIPSLMVLLAVIRRQNCSRHASLKRVLVSLVWGLGFFSLQLTWLSYPAASWIPWILLVILEALFIGIFGEIWGRGEALIADLPKVFSFLRFLWAPLCWVGIEQLRSLVPFNGFPWSKLAFSQVDSPLVAWAPWGGSAAVSGVSVCLALCCLEIFTPRPGVWRRLVCSALAVVVVVLPWLVPLPTPTAFGNIRVAVVQGNTPGRDPQTAYGAPYEVLHNHVAQSLALAQSEREVDLVAWGENAADVDPRTDAKARQLVNRVTQRFSAPLVTGTVSRAPSQRRANTIIYWESNKAQDYYVKQHVVPFGEYLPLRSFITQVFPQFAALVPVDLSAGQTVAQIRMRLAGKSFVAASPICYEIADDALVRQAVTGAAFIYLPTSNTFFGASDQSLQQLYIARFRAREHGLDTISVSTMSQTARISQTGELLGRVIPSYTAGSFVTSIPLRHGTTPATLIGGALNTATLVILVLASLFEVMLGLNRSWHRERK